MLLVALAIVLATLPARAFDVVEASIAGGELVSKAIVHVVVDVTVTREVIVKIDGEERGVSQDVVEKVMDHRRDERARAQ